MMDVFMLATVTSIGLAYFIIIDTAFVKMTFLIKNVFSTSCKCCGFSVGQRRLPLQSVMPRRAFGDGFGRFQVSMRRHTAANGPAA
jgi:hypothetical protein